MRSILARTRTGRHGALLLLASCVCLPSTDLQLVLLCVNRDVFCIYLFIYLKIGLPVVAHNASGIDTHSKNSRLAIFHFRPALNIDEYLTHSSSSRIYVKE